MPQLITATQPFKGACLAFELSWIFGEENHILRAQELLLDSLCKHSMPVSAVCPELHLPFSQFFLLYLAIYYYMLIVL